MSQISTETLTEPPSPTPLSVVKSDALTILLIRAGRTEYDCQNRIQGTLDVPLSERGRVQVAAAAAELSEADLAVDAFYTGPCLSVRETAAALAPVLSVKPKAIPGLYNLNMGLWQGLLFADVKAKQPKVFRQWHEQPETVCPPEGESLADARQRLHQVLTKLAKKHKAGETIAMLVSPPLATVLSGLLRDEAVGGFCQSADGGLRMWEKLAYPRSA